jgi:hypothetical protein
MKKTRSPLDRELLDLLPGAARELALEGRILETEQGEWQPDVGWPPEEVGLLLPPGAIILANNGDGDFLFLQPAGAAGVISSVVYVFWHEGPEVAIFAPDISVLANSLETPSGARQPLYADGSPVSPGDHVQLRVWVRLFRKVAGTVVYVPGISKRRPQLERDGLSWVGVRLDDTGTIVGSWVEPSTGRLQK